MPRALDSVCAIVGFTEPPSSVPGFRRSPVQFSLHHADGASHEWHRNCEIVPSDGRRYVREQKREREVRA